MTPSETDVLVIGAGNAALCAALAAREQGAEVVVLESAPETEQGGNSRFTGGAIRFAFEDIDELRQVIPDLSDREITDSDFGTYSRAEFFDDMARLTRYRADSDLVEMLVDQSHETMLWLRRHSVRFVPSYGRQAFKVDGRFRFWGGLAVEILGGGPGLIEALLAAVVRSGAELLYQARATSLIYRDGAVHGANVQRQGQSFSIHAKAVVLACGGFEANAEWRARYLGPGWDLAKVRGSRFNVGDGIRMALDIGAMPYGHWSGCHAVGWDRNAPDFGDLAVGDGFQKHSYPFGIIVNARGERFVDEGADFRNYTYAMYGHAILEQPGQFAWQIFDDKVTHLLRDEYRIRQVSRVTAVSLEDLAAKLDDMDSEACLNTIHAFNDSIRSDVPFVPAVKDGRRTKGLSIPKSNWSNAIDTPPFQAFAVTCGITFTFGGLRIDKSARVLDLTANDIRGLFAAGELVGGLFYSGLSP